MGPKPAFENVQEVVTLSDITPQILGMIANTIESTPHVADM
jgi:hypothetical protein